MTQPLLPGLGGPTTTPTFAARYPAFLQYTAIRHRVGVFGGLGMVSSRYLPPTADREPPAPSAADVVFPRPLC
jgi:hypothetical protein